MPNYRSFGPMPTGAAYAGATDGCGTVAVSTAGLMRERDAALKRIAELEADRDQLRSTIMTMIRYENKCSQLGENCTGWDAEKCGCAVEARLNVKLGVAKSGQVRRRPA